MDGEGEGRSEGLRGEEEVENTVGMQYMRIMNKKKRIQVPGASLQREENLATEGQEGKP